MSDRVELNSVYGPSDEIVAREIEGEIIIVPLTSGIADFEDELFTLNETARAIWQKLDGEKTIASIISELKEQYEAPAGVIEEETLGLISELIKRRILVKKK